MTKYNFNVKKIAAELGVTTVAIYNRIRNGWDIEDAVSVGYIPQKERIYNHKKKYDVDIKKAAEKLGLNENTIYLRLRKGWPLEKAISTPSKQGKYKNTCKPAPVKIEPVKINVISCDKLTASVQRLNAAIDKILTLKTVKPKVILKDAGTDLRKLTEHFVNMTDDDKHRYNNACGGVKINILNHVNADKKEFKYNVIDTNGKCLKTNNKSEFLTFLRDEVA